MNRLWKPICRFIALGAAALLLSGCISSAAITTAKLGIQTSTEFNETFLVDVQNAALLAAATEDKLAMKCYAYLEQFTVENAPGVDGTPVGEVVGVLSGYQQARNIRRTVVEVEISDALRLECGPMAMETLGVIGRVGFKWVSPL